MGRLEPGQFGDWENNKPVSGGSDPDVNRRRLRAMLGDELADQISVEAQMRYLARHAPKSEISTLFLGIMRATTGWDLIQQHIDAEDDPDA
jgi:hypothetical protein